MPVPNVGTILEWWRDRFDECEAMGFFLDWGEPTCFGCDQGWEGKYDITNPKASWPEIVRCWERAPLQRCHIVPRSLSGSDHPSNIVLMCRECHDLAPDTSDREMFFRWAKAQSWYQRRVRELRQCFSDFGFDPEDEALVNQLTSILVSTDFHEWCKGKVGLHGFQRLPLGVRVSPSSFVAALTTHYETRYLGVKSR